MAHVHNLALADPRVVYPQWSGAWHCDGCGYASVGFGNAASTLS